MGWISVIFNTSQSDQQNIQRSPAAKEEMTLNDLLLMRKCFLFFFLNPTLQHQLLRSAALTSCFFWGFFWSELNPSTPLPATTSQKKTTWSSQFPTS